jgi:hypothetical protein
MRLVFAAVALFLAGSSTAVNFYEHKKPPTGEEGGACYNL